jgi:hypothetical protein
MHSSKPKDIKSCRKISNGLFQIIHDVSCCCGVVTGFQLINIGSFRAAIIRWLAPPLFKDSFEYAQDVREDGTAEWLFRDLKFEAWVSSPDTTNPKIGSHSKAMIWVQGLSRLRSVQLIANRWMAGNPGWGKTVVAASTIEEIGSRHTSNGSNPIVCYYFFNQQDLANGSSARLAAYRAINSQIFQHCHQTEEIYDIYALANDGSNSTASGHELLDLLNMTIPLLSDLYLILDGLDELNDVDVFMADIRTLCENSSLKVMLFSRPHVASLRDVLESEQTITMSRGTMNTDIRVFVRHQINVLGQQNRFPQNADLSLVEEKIVEQADGMFLWARLMISYLNSPALTKSQRMSIIFNTTPVGLQQMYDRILSQITSMDDASKQLATTIFSWIAYAREDLSADEISDVVGSEAEDEDSSERKEYIDRAVIVVCCGLIEKRQNGTLRFIHLTAKEHLLTQSLGKGSTLILSSLEAHIEIARRCLSYLLFSVPAQPLSGRLSVAADYRSLRCQYPLLSYSATHWPRHLASGAACHDSAADPTRRQKLMRLFDLIDKFLAHPIVVTVWVEAALLFQGKKALIVVNEILETFRDSFEACPDLKEYSSTVKTLTLFAHDLQRIDEHWSSLLESSPHEIWGDVSSFTKSRFLCQNRGVAVETFAPSRDNHPTKHTDPIFCIGSKNNDCTLIGKLTIYPSRSVSWFSTLLLTAADYYSLASCSAFHTLWKSKPFEYDQNWFKPFLDDAHLQKYCKEWYARYDIHQIGEDSGPLFTKYITLSAEEISLQMQFSFRLSPTRIWKLKFPMSISPDLSTVVVLRTFITADFSTEQQAALNEIYTNIPNFGHHELLRQSWSKKTFVPALPYLYEWAFSADTSYAIFRDWNMETNYGIWAIIRLDRSRSSIASDVLEYHEHKEDFHRFGPRLCAMHPFESKMVMLDRNDLIFKDFTTGELPQSIRQSILLLTYYLRFRIYQQSTTIFRNHQARVFSVWQVLRSVSRRTKPARNPSTPVGHIKCRAICLGIT